MKIRKTKKLIKNNKINQQGKIIYINVIILL